MHACEFHLNEEAEIRWPTINARSGMVPHKTRDEFTKPLLVHIRASHRLKHDIDVIHSP